jgi:DNA-directed RNA polymerase subunit beta'
MLASHNILKPQMVRQLQTFSGHGFGTILYDQRASTPEKKILGQDLTFYSAEEVNIALNEGRLELNARVRIRAKDFNEAGELVYKIIQTTAGRVI